MTDLRAERETWLQQESALQERLRHHTKLGHELDEVRQELTERMKELHQRHLELRHCKSDLAVKQAFIDRLRREVRATKDEITNELVRHRGDSERLQQEVTALRAYSTSAGFRLVERGISVLRRIPFVFSVTRSVVRTAAGKPRE